MSNNTLHSDRYWRQRAGYIEQEKELARTRQAPAQEWTPADVTASDRAEAWFAQESEAMENYAERQAIDAIHQYVVNRDGEATCKRGKEAAGQIIRQWLELRGESELEDVERGLKAILATRRTGKDSYDVRSLPWQLVKKLHAAGCLLIDVDMLNQKANAALRMESEPAKVPAGETTYLRVVSE